MGDIEDTGPARLSGAGPFDRSLAELRRAVLLLFGLLLVAKLVLAFRLGLFGDGAFYWLEAQRLAPSYSDVPFLTPALVRLGIELWGDTLFGARSMFLLIGSLLPPAVYLLARRFTGAREALLAAVFAMLMPIPAFKGLLIVPEVPLVVISVLALIAFETARRSAALWPWLLLGGLCALGFNAHYRFVLFVLAGLLYVALTPVGRATLRRPGFWAAAAITLAGLVPILAFNLQSDFAAINFHFRDRHPWAFHTDGLLYPVRQAVWVSPPLYLALLLTLAHCIGKAARGSDGHALIAIFGGTNLLLFHLLAPWAVGSESFTAHWPVFGYICLLVYLPETMLALLSRLQPALRRAVAWLVPATGLLFVGGTLLGLGLSANYANLPPPARVLATDKMAGWQEIGQEVQDLLAAEGADMPVVASEYYLGAQIAFVTKRREGVYSLDDARLAEHGRAAQQRIWKMDEAGLRHAHPGGRALVVIDRAQLEGAAGAELAGRLCGLFETLRLRGDLSLHDGERRYGFFLGDGILPAGPSGSAAGAADTPGACIEDADRPA
jgi:4-amino-4-deoxy-L-arabinose transferase-like glycosyltransferase